MVRAVVLAVSALTLASCASTDGANGDSDPSDLDPVTWTSPDGKADVSGIPPVFDRNNVMTDALFGATAAVDADAVQAFLESSPYGTRSWLADVQLGNQRFSDAVVSIAVARGLDPVVLLVRAQVESSLVSATVQPSSTRINAALGCGCADGSSCSSADRGLQSQLICAADVFATQFTDSQNGTGGWRINHTRTSSDGLPVTPRTNATAALYAYTPWVLTGSGGNWLAWNVTRRFLKEFDAAGTLNLP